jgi:predicted TIM-barrel fold metal-dependent hydrolase
MNRREWLMRNAGVAALGRGAALAQRPPAPHELAAPPATPDKLLLKDYRPRSIYRIPRTDIRRAKYPIIDAHHHGALVPSPAQLDKTVRMMDAVGMEKTVVFVQDARPEKIAAIRQAYSRYAERFDLWCYFDLAGCDQPGFGPQAVQALEECHRQGAVGVGEIIDKGRGLFRGQPEGSVFGPHVDDPRMDPLYDQCARLGMPINVHVAEPMWNYEPMDNSNDAFMNSYTWKVKRGPDVRGHPEMIESLERALKKHPRTTFIACHLANMEYDLTGLGQILDRHPNLYADLGGRSFAQIAPLARSAATFFQQHPDRILYGTDWPYTQLLFSTTFRILESSDEHFYIWDPVVPGTTVAFEDYRYWDNEIAGFACDFDYHWPLYGLALADDILRKVYGENARQVFERSRANAG